MSRTVTNGSNTNRRGRGRNRGNQHDRNTNANSYHYNLQQPNLRGDYTSEDFIEDKYGQEDFQTTNTRGNWRGRGRNDFKNNGFKREAPARSHSSSSSSSSRNENMNKVHSNNYSQPQRGRMFGADSSRLPNHSQTPIFANELMHNFNSIMPPSELLTAEAPSFVQPRPEPSPHTQPRIFPNQSDNGRDLTFASISSSVSQGFRDSRSRSPKNAFGSGHQKRGSHERWSQGNDSQKPLRDEFYQTRFLPVQDGNPRERFTPTFSSGDIHFDIDPRLHSGPHTNSDRSLKSNLPPYIDKRTQPNVPANIENQIQPNLSVNKARRNQILIDNGFKGHLGKNHVNHLDPSNLQNPSGYAVRNGNQPLLDLPRQFDNYTQANSSQGVALQNYNGSRNFAFQDPGNANFISHSGKGLTHGAVAGGQFNIRSPAGNPYQPTPSRTETLERLQAEYDAKAVEHEAKEREKEAKKREQKLAKYKHIDQGHSLTDGLLGEAAGYQHGFGHISEVRQRQQEQLNHDAGHFREREREETQERNQKEEDKRKKELMRKSKFVDIGYKLGHGGNRGNNRGGRQRRAPRSTAEDPGSRDKKSTSNSASPINPELLEGKSLEDQLELEFLIYSEIARQKEIQMNAEQQQRNSTDKHLNKERSATRSQSYQPGHQGQSTSPQVPPVLSCTQTSASVVEATSNNVTEAPLSKEAKELAKQFLDQLETLMAKPSATPEESNCIQEPTQSKETTVTTPASVFGIPSQGPEGDAQQTSVSVTKPAQRLPSPAQSVKNGVTVPPANKEAQERELLLRLLVAKCFMTIPAQTAGTSVVQEASLPQNSKLQFNEAKIVKPENKNKKAEEEKPGNSKPELLKKNIETNTVHSKHKKQEAEKDAKTSVPIRQINKIVVEETNIYNPRNQIQEIETKPASCVLKNPSLGAVLVLRPTEKALQRALSSRPEVQDEIDKQGYSALYKPTVHEPPQYLNNRFERQPFPDTAKATGAVTKQKGIGLTQNTPVANCNPSTSAPEPTSIPEPVIDHQAELRAARLRMQQQYEDSLKKQQENPSST